MVLLFADARQVAGLHRQPEAPDAVAGLLGYRPHLAEGFTLLGGVARNLMHQRRTGDAARLLVIGQGDIVRDNHHLNLQAVAFGFLRREAEVEAVPGVVFDYQQAATIAGDGDDGVKHGVDAGGGEHVSADGGGEHPFADEAGVSGLVAGATAGDDRHAALVPVAARNDADSGIDIETHQVSVRCGDN